MMAVKPEDRPTIAEALVDFDRCVASTPEDVLVARGQRFISSSGHFWPEHHRYFEWVETGQRYAVWD